MAPLPLAHCSEEKLQESPRADASESANSIAKSSHQESSLGKLFEALRKCQSACNGWPANARCTCYHHLLQRVTMPSHKISVNPKLQAPHHGHHRLREYMALSQFIFRFERRRCKSSDFVTGVERTEVGEKNIKSGSPLF